MTAPGQDLVGLDVHGAVGGTIGVLTLNDPAHRNALTVEMGRAFVARVRGLAEEPDLRAVVLTGAPPAFSAGGDLDWLSERAQAPALQNAQEMRAFYRRFLSFKSLGVPVIAAVNGHAIGAGLSLAAACDLRIVASDAKLGATFVGLGLHPGMGATAFLPQAAGPELASWMLLSGELLDGESAAQRGFALEHLDRDRVLERALEMAKIIAKKAPLAVRETTKSLRLLRDEGMDRALRREADAQAMCYATRDFKVGVEALQEKKAPTFKGA